MGIFAKGMADFKMGLTDLFGEQTGFGANGNPETHNLDPDAYAQYYNDALNAMRTGQNKIDAVGTDEASAKMRGSLNNAVQGQLDQLDNNAAGRKKNYEEDMSRSFGNDTQNMARAKGGTGSLAQALNPSGGMYDSQARATSRGYNDLYSQATKDIGSLNGVQSNLYGQDMTKATNSAGQGNKIAGAQLGELSARRGIAQDNAQNSRTSEALGAEKRSSTLGSVGSMVGGMFAKGGRVAPSFSDGGSPLDSIMKIAPLAMMALNEGGEVPKFGGGGMMGSMMGMLDPLGLMGGMGGGGKDKGGGGGGGGPMGMAKGGMANNCYSDGGSPLDSIMKIAPLAMMALSEGGEPVDRLDASHLGKNPVPGKASVKGNSLKNDKVPAWLSPEEVVLPRSVTKSKQPEKKAAKFVHETMKEGKHQHKIPKFAMGGDMGGMGAADAGGAAEAESAGSGEEDLPMGGGSGGGSGGESSQAPQQEKDDTNPMTKFFGAMGKINAQAASSGYAPSRKFSNGGMMGAAQKAMAKLDGGKKKKKAAR